MKEILVLLGLVLPVVIRAQDDAIEDRQPENFDVKDNDDDDPKSIVAIVIVSITIGALVLCCVVTCICHLKHGRYDKKKDKKFVNEYDLADISRSR